MMLDRLNDRLRFVMTATAVIVGAAFATYRYADFLDLDVNFESYSAPQGKRFGGDCYYATAPWAEGQTFAGARTQAQGLTLKPIVIPYKLVEPPLTVAAGDYLYVSCPLDLSRLSPSGFGWLELGPLAGPTAVFLGGTQRLEQTDGERAGFPLLPADRVRGQSLEIVAQGHADRVGQPGPSTGGGVPFVTDNRADLVARERYETSTDRMAIFHLAYALTLLLLFSVAWFNGMRYPDVSWMIIIAAVLAARSMTLLAPGGARTLFDVQAFHAAHTVMSVALPCFVYSFFRLKIRRFSPEVALIVALVAAATLWFGFMSEVKRAIGFEIVVPQAIGAVLLAWIGTIGLTRRSDYPLARRRRVLQMSLVALVGAGVYGAAAFAFATGRWTAVAAFDLYLPYLVTLVFACFLLYDLVIYHRNYFEEKAARLESERRGAQNDAIARTTQMLAHDVRKPFTLLKLGLERLAAAVDGPAIAKTAGRLVADVDRSLVQVDAMLDDVMEIGADRKPTLTPTDPKELLSTAVAEAWQVHRPTALAVRYDLRHSRAVAVDAHKMGRVLANVIGNAVQATKGTGNLTLRAADARTSTGDAVSLAIGNDGPLIEPRDLPQLFEPFFTKGKSSGTGLGLAIAKKIVGAHGGTIVATSDAASGTTFIITLPAVAGLEALPRTAAPPMARPQLGRPKVLLVEDEIFIREAWISALSADADVKACTTPEEVLAVLERDPQTFHAFAGVVVDFNFEAAGSSLDGADLAIRLRAAGYGGAVVLATEVPPLEPCPAFDAVVGKTPQSWSTLAREVQTAAATSQTPESPR